MYNGPVALKVKVCVNSVMYKRIGLLLGKKLRVDELNSMEDIND